jgi:hypothetical protein
MSGDVDLGVRLFLTMAREGLTLSEAAARSGISMDRLGQFLWNCAEPEPHEVQLLVDALGAALGDDLTGAEAQLPRAPSQVGRSLRVKPLDSVALETGCLYERALARIDQLGGHAAGSDEAGDLARLMEIVDATRPSRNGQPVDHSTSANIAPRAETVSWT